MVAYVEIDKVADIEVDMVADIDIDMEIQFGERFGHGGWLIGPKLFRPEAYPACASSKLCEFIIFDFSSLSEFLDKLVGLWAPFGSR